MTLAPIRGAPPGAPNPDFPVESLMVQPARRTTSTASEEQPPVRQRHTPIEIEAGGVTFTFRVIPEQPAIARASLTVHMVAGGTGSSSSQTLGFLRMSASNARTFLTNLRDDRSPTVAMGDEAGNVQIEYESSPAGPALVVRKPREQDALGRWVLDRDLKAAANELLADLGRSPWFLQSIRGTPTSVRPFHVPNAPVTVTIWFCCREGRRWKSTE